MDANGTTVQTQPVNAADQLTMSGYSYDAAGNELHGAYGTETWNAADQMITLNDGTAHTYSYAGTDQTELITDGVGRNFTYGRSGSTGLPLVESFTQSGSTFSYLYDPTGTPLAIEGGNTHYVDLDGLGSVIATINHNGATTTTYSYDAWGNQTAAAQNGSGIGAYQLYGYTGGIPDPIDGLLHLGHRWYDSHNGRFTQRDSIVSLADPSRANRYEYAGDNPVNFVDLPGTISFGSLLAHCGLGALQSSIVSLFTGEAETGVGLLFAAVRGCGVSAIADYFAQRGEESVAKSLETVATLKDILEVLEHVFNL